jgi:hypothetical protein
LRQNSVKTDVGTCNEDNLQSKIISSEQILNSPTQVTQVPTITPMQIKYFITSYIKSLISLNNRFMPIIMSTNFNLEQNFEYIQHLLKMI